jgi:hypothetical protein
MLWHHALNERRAETLAVVRGVMEQIESEPFEAIVAVGQDWHHVDRMGSVFVGDGRVVLRDRNGAVIVEAPATEVYAKGKKLWIMRVWMGGGRYSIGRPMATLWDDGGGLKPAIELSLEIRRGFLQALAEQGGHIGKPPVSNTGMP